MSASQRVLVVDDDLLNQEVISEFLAIGDYAIDLADDGQQAVEMVENNDYDLVLMDIMMPTMDGVVATRAIRALPDAAKNSVRVIAVTAKNARDNAHVWKRSGFNNYIIKPFSEDELWHIIASEDRFKTRS